MEVVLVAVSSGTHGRCLLNDLLVSSLDTAVSLKQVDVVAVLVTKYLHLNVPTDQPHHQYIIIHLLIYCYLFTMKVVHIQTQNKCTRN